MSEVYADSIQAKVNGTDQSVPLRDSDAQQQLATKAPGIVETASGESIQIADSSDLPLAGLRIYGKGIQDGEASPENSVPINIPGEDGNIEVNFTGSQLLNVTSQESARLEIKVSNDVISLIRNVNCEQYTRIIYNSILKIENEMNITLQYNNLLGNFLNGNLVEIRDSKNNIKLALTNTVKSKSKSLSPGLYSVVIYSGNTYGSGDASIIGLRITNNPDDAWEPFKEPQQLTILTPNGLPGIPVSSGGNYTDASGQQWISDIYDAIAGEYHHYTATIESYNGETITTPYISTTGSLTTGAKIVYALETPTVESVEPFTANSYYPNTNILTDDTVQPDIEVDYVADTKLYIDNKIATVSAQIVNQAGGN